MMESIIVIVNDALSEGITHEEEDSDIPEQHVVLNVLDNNTNILIPTLDNNTNNFEGIAPEDKMSSSRIQKNHPIKT